MEATKQTYVSFGGTTIRDLPRAYELNESLHLRKQRSVQTLLRGVGKVKISCVDADEGFGSFPVSSGVEEASRSLFDQRAWVHDRALHYHGAVGTQEDGNEIVDEEGDVQPRVVVDGTDLEDERFRVGCVPVGIFDERAW